MIALVVLAVTILLTSGAGFFFNNAVMPSPVLNFMLISMAFSAVFSNMVSEARLDYHLILGAGLFTAFGFPCL